MIEQVVLQVISLPEVLEFVSDWRVKDALSRIHAKPQTDWQEGDLAKGFRLSPDYFRHLFADHAGLGLPHYLTELRVICPAIVRHDRLVTPSDCRTGGHAQ